MKSPSHFRNLTQIKMHNIATCVKCGRKMNYIHQMKKWTENSTEHLLVLVLA